MIKKRLSSIFLTFLLFSTNILNLRAMEQPHVVQQPEVTEQPEIEQQPQVEQSKIEQDQEADKAQLEKVTKDLENLLADTQISDDTFSPLDFFQQPAKMAEKLPDDCKKIVLQAWDECNNLLANLQNPILFLFDVIQDLGIKSEEIREQAVCPKKETLDKLVQALQEAQKLLGSQKFQFALQLGVVREDLKKEIQGLSDNLAQVSKLIDQENSPEKEIFKDNLEILKDSFGALVTGNFNIIAQYQQIYLQTKSKQTFQLLENANLILDELAQKSDKDDKELEEAIVFWQETLKEFSVLRSYFAGPSKWMKVLNVVGKTTPYIEGIYFFYHKFIELYKTDHKDVLRWNWDNVSSTNGILGLLGDQTFRLCMVPIHFLRRAAQLGKTKKFNSQQSQFLFQQLIGECVGIYLDPNFCVKNLMWPMRAFYRIAPASAYIASYNWFNGKNPLEHFTQDKKFRRAVWFSLKDGYRSLAYFLEGQIYRKIDREKLKKLEEMFLGIVKPELLSAALDTLMPLLTYKYFPKYIAEIERKDVFAKEYSKLEDYFWDWNYVGETDSKKITDSCVNATPYFIEGRILGYLATSLGTHFGRKFTQKHKRPIKSLLSKGVRGCTKVLAKLGFLDEEYINWQDQIKDEIKEGLMVLSQDPALVILIQQFLFPMLVGFGIMNQLEVAKLEKTLMSGQQLDEKEINLIVDKIFSSVADKMVIGAGGWVGAFISWYVANWMMQEYGPFYPKAKNYFKQTFV